MKFFLDSAIVDEIQHALTMWNIDGITTNPRHVQVSGKPFLTVIQEIGELVAGTDVTISDGGAFLRRRQADESRVDQIAGGAAVVLPSRFVLVGLR